MLDPEVSTLNTLNNVQNSLFVPDLGRFLNRRPTYNLTKRPSDLVTKPRSRRGSRASRGSVSLPQDTTEFNKDQPIRPSIDRSNTLKTIDSTLSDTRYAVLPHGISLEGWSKEDKQELNDHVRHFLHSKRSRFKRSMRGFGQYLRKRKSPLLLSSHSSLLTFESARVFRHLVRLSHHCLWPHMGSFPYRLGQCWGPKILRHQRHRQRSCRPVCHNG